MSGSRSLLYNFKRRGGYYRSASEVQPYLERLERDNVKLFIFETHFHADFVSGHLDLSKATGAPIVYGPTAKTDFESIIATDNQEFQKKQYKSVTYPGHTMETTYLLLDEMVQNMLSSGDTLFIGDVEDLI
jgi:glyoxylase-like metal-dependent hydrolase (beta-lactamase superfamily II)